MGERDLHGSLLRERSLLALMWLARRTAVVTTGRPYLGATLVKASTRIPVQRPALLRK